MENVRHNSNIDKHTGVDAVAMFLGKDVIDAARRVERGIQDAKAAVTEKLEDSKIATARMVKRARYALEDGVEEGARNIKRHPFRALGIAFATGAVLDLLLPRPGRGRRGLRLSRAS